MVAHNRKCFYFSILAYYSDYYASGSLRLLVIYFVVVVSDVVVAASDVLWMTTLSLHSFMRSSRAEWIIAAVS